MTCYRVNFFNNLINSNGQAFKCLQQSFIIPEANDEAEAVEKAKREFEHSECISNWRCHAHLVEVEPAFDDQMESHRIGGIGRKLSRIADYESKL